MPRSVRLPPPGKRPGLFLIACVEEAGLLRPFASTDLGGSTGDALIPECVRHLALQISDYEFSLHKISFATSWTMPDLENNTFGRDGDYFELSAMEQIAVRGIIGDWLNKNRRK